MHTRLAAAALVLVTSGCVSLQRFGTARTLEKGEANTSITFDGILARMPARERLEGTALPVFHLRHNRGIAPGTELVLDLGLPGTVGADVKRELFRGNFLDLAVAPGISASWLGEEKDFLAEGHLPLVADLVLLPWLVLVPQASIGWAIAQREDAMRDSALVGGGTGVYLRLGDGFAIQPSATAVVELDTFYTHYRFGLGFSFGTQPRFD